MKSVEKFLRDIEEKKNNGDWYPACGGTEKPFIIRGRKLLYCWQPSTGRHAYLDCDTDIFLTEKEVLKIFSLE